MSAPKPKDGDGRLPPPEDAHEIFLPIDDDPLIVLGPDAPPVPLPAVPAPPAAPAPPRPHTQAVIDDIPAVKPLPASPPPPPRAQAEYTTDPPSIATDRVRDPFLFPAATVEKPSPWPRRALLVGVGALLAI